MPIKPLMKTFNGDDAMCGHYSVAMVTEVPVEEVVNLLGHRGLTTINEIRKAIVALGFEVEEAFKESARDGVGIVIALNAWKTQGHCTAWENGVIIDPDGEFTGRTLDHYSDVLRANGWSIYELWKVTPIKTREWEVG